MATKNSSKAEKPAKAPLTPERYEMFMRLGLLTIAVFIDLLGFSIIIPLIPSYVADGLHLHGAQAHNDPNIGRLGAWLVAVYAGMQFVFAPVWGRLSDKIGRKPILMMSLIGDAVFYSLFALGQSNIYVLFASRILAGIFSSASISVAQAYVADVTPPEYRAMGLGHLGAAFGVGFIVGPALGGWLGKVNLGLPLYFAAALAVANAIYIYIKLPESRTVKEITSPPGNETKGVRLARMARGIAGPIGFLFLLTFLVTFAFSQLEGTFTAYIMQRFGYGESNAPAVSGSVFAYVGLILVVIQGGAIRPLTKKYGETRLVLTGILLMAVGFLTFSLAHSLLWLMLGPLIPISAGVALNNPSLRSLISRKSAADVQGGTLGLSASFDSLARFLGPAIAGELYQKIGLTAPFWCAGIFMAFALIFALAQKTKMEITMPSSLVVEPATDAELLSRITPGTITE